MSNLKSLWLRFWALLMALLTYFLMSLLISLVAGFFASDPFLFKSESSVVYDRLILYLLVFHAPYLLSYFLLKKLLANLNFEICYLVVCGLDIVSLISIGKNEARGMAVDSHALYCSVLAIPYIIISVSMMIVMKSAFWKLPLPPTNRIEPRANQ